MLRPVITHTVKMGQQTVLMFYQKFHDDDTALIFLIQLIPLHGKMRAFIGAEHPPILRWTPVLVVSTNTGSLKTIIGKPLCGGQYFE